MPRIRPAKERIRTYIKNTFRSVRKRQKQSKREDFEQAFHERRNTKKLQAYQKMFCLANN